MNELVVQNVNILDSVNLDEIQAMMKKINTYQTIIQTNLKDGLDYGTIPGTNKPTLFKPGGEKITLMFGLNPEYELFSSTEDYKAEFFSYNIRCTLYKNGQPCAQGVGSCNSKEKKYRYVNVDEVPAGYVGASEQFTNSYGQIKYKIENQDICSLVNTILKMAKKRAFMDAVLQVASLSEIFTQDLEDMQDFVRQESHAASGTMSSEDAGRVKVSFGKYKGKTMGDIYREKGGPDYIKWLAENATTANVKTAAKVMLDAVTASKKQKPNVVSEAEPGELPTEGPDGEIIQEGYAGTPFDIDDISY